MSAANICALRYVYEQTSTNVRATRVSMVERAKTWSTVIHARAALDSPEFTARQVSVPDPYFKQWLILVISC